MLIVSTFFSGTGLREKMTVVLGLTAIPGPDIEEGVHFLFLLYLVSFEN